MRERSGDAETGQGGADGAREVLLAGGVVYDDAGDQDIFIRADETAAGQVCEARTRGEGRGSRAAHRGTPRRGRPVRSGKIGTIAAGLEIGGGWDGHGGGGQAHCVGQEAAKGARVGAVGGVGELGARGRRYHEGAGTGDDGRGCREMVINPEGTTGQPRFQRINFTLPTAAEAGCVIRPAGGVARGRRGTDLGG